MKSIRIGFIGLGIMGRPMALNLIRGGYPLWVYARRRESLPPLLEAGAQACESVAALSRQVDLLFTMVSATADVEQLLLGADGAAEHGRSGLITVDMSTIDPTSSRGIARALESRAMHHLDAPVSGGERGAIDGTLSIMVGGRSDIFEQLLPLFQCMGESIVHVGESGAGQIAKACNQILVAQSIAAVGEALLLARANGVDPGKVREALLGGFAGSRILDVHGQRMIDGDYEPGFKSRLHHKDMQIALRAAEQAGVALPGAALAAQLISAQSATDGERDSASLVEALERLSGVTIRPLKEKQ